MNPQHSPFYTLLTRVGEHGKIGLYYSTRESFSVIFCNHAATTLFDMPPRVPEEPPIAWDLLPPKLQGYLTLVLEKASGAPEEKMPLYVDSESIDTAPCDVTLYYEACEQEKEEDHKHFYLLDFQRSLRDEQDPEKELEAKKLETIGELASGVAHDFNNLIMGMQGNAQLMLARNQLQDEDRKRLVNIIRGCTAGASLTKSLLQYAKRQAIEMARFDVVLMVKDVVNLIGLSLGSRYTLKLEEPLAFENQKLPVVGCFSSLSHCLLNLIKNARDAMPDGGTISIVWNGDLTTASLTVIDSGTGISPEDLEHVFEPFYTTKKQGTGLGLAMAHSILSQHEGEVRVESTIGEGTRVSLIWPRGDFQSESIRRTDLRRSTGKILAPNKSNVLQKKTQLAYLIDDDEIVCAAMSGMLSLLGYEVKAFPKAEAALSTLNPNEVPALVVTDYHMPGMDGTEFIRHWHNELPSIYREKAVQFILISGHPTSHFTGLFREFPELKIILLQKPFTIEALGDAIQGLAPSGLEQANMDAPESDSALGSLLRKASQLITRRRN